MDKDAERKVLEDERAFVASYVNHPLALSIEEDSMVQQDALVAILTDRTIDSIESFFAHFEAVGHLRGLRRSRALALAKLEEVKDKLKELEDNGN